MYYVILTSLWKDSGSIVHVEKMCVLLRVRAIKHAICSLPLVPNAQRANLTLSSNPLNWKGTNAYGLYSTSDKPIHFINAYVEWCSIDFESILFVSPISFNPPPISAPVSPSLHPTDGLPLTEHWHQMCSSSVDSGTSWAECASGSVNENGFAVCVCVCTCCLLWFSGMWQLGNAPWVRVLRMSHIKLHCSSTQPCSAQQQTHQGWNHTPTHPEWTHTLSLHCIPITSFHQAVCFSFVSHNPQPYSYIIIYSFL